MRPGTEAGSLDRLLRDSPSPLTRDPSGPSGVGADPLVPLRNSRSSPILGRAPPAESLAGKPDEPRVLPTDRFAQRQPTW